MKTSVLGAIPMPDVGRAILLNQVNPEVDSKKRMADLHKRRKETYAIRDLWKNMQERKAKRHQEARERLAGPSACRLRQLRDQMQHYENIRSSKGRQDQQSGIRRSATSFGSTNNYLYKEYLLRPYTSAGPSDSAPSSGRRHQDKDEDIPYHTAITMPPEQRSRDVTSFNALNRKPMCRLPNIYDAKHHLPGYTTTDIKEWKNEIRKIVPMRPKIFTSAEIPLRPMSIIMPPEIERSNDPACFFRCTVDKSAGKDKEYMINPEWPSEKHTVESARSRAHCVYTWNV